MTTVNGNVQHQGGTGLLVQDNGGFGPLVEFTSSGTGSLNIQNVGVNPLRFITFVGNSLTATSSTIALFSNGTTLSATGDVNLFTNNLNLTGGAIQTTNGVITVTANSGGFTVDGTERR